jgi:glutamate dehydrogenase
MRGYDVVDGTIRVRDGSGLGIMRDDSSSHYAHPKSLAELPSAQVDKLLAPQLVRVARTAQRSRVQRRAPMDAIVVLERDDAHRVTGLTRIVGLFTRGALAQPARSTPVLRRRLSRLLEAEDVVAGSYDEAQLTEVFEAIPRDELFGASPEELRRMVVDLVLARERDDVRAVVREDPSTSTVSIVATVPRYRYEPAVRRAFTSHLVDLLTTEAGEPEIDVDVSLAQDHEVLVRFAVHLPGGVDLAVPTAEELGAELHRITRSWGDTVAAALEERVGEAAAHRLQEEVVSRLPKSYQEVTSAPEAIEDVLAIDEQQHDLDIRIVVGEEGHGRIRTLVRDRRLVLSDFLPLLEDLGLDVLDERPHALQERQGVANLHLHDFGVRGLSQDLTVEDQVRVADTLRASWTERTSSDSLHRLVLSAGLTWLEVSVLRTYRRYRRQVGTAYTPSYVNDALAANPASPVRSWTTSTTASTRSAPGPLPRDLRLLAPGRGRPPAGGPVARGGLRWSDRQDDVRTEVLGLMKAQMLKNAVIVPTGAKGGFVLKRPGGPRRAARRGRAAVRQVFVRGLLDVTDDLDGARSCRRPGVSATTATTPTSSSPPTRAPPPSPTRQRDRRRYGFWLGRRVRLRRLEGLRPQGAGHHRAGAWVAVPPLPRARDRRADRAVSVVGVGDMSGDVFGNGLLRSRTIRLVAAFDHRDIFLDPDPDPAASFEERSGCSPASLDLAGLRPGPALPGRSWGLLPRAPRASR